MRRITTLLFLLMMVVVSQAAPVTKQQARQWAQDFMSQLGAQLKGEPRRAPGVDADTEQQPLYIFNTEANKGFVIIAGDDNAEHVLGYTTEGTYDESRLPDNFRSWLEMTAEEISSLPSAEKEQTAARAPLHVPTHPAISPLIKTKWNQGSNKTTDSYIYNTLTPTIGTKHCLTGCVATAGAQIMYYYQHPKKATQTVPGYTIEGSAVNNQTEKDLPPIKFKWSNMKKEYTQEDVGTDSETAVSQLMKYCGWAAHMNYNLNSSGAHEGLLANKMAEYFDYNPNTIQIVTREAYTVSEWDEIIYDELSQGRPIIYSGKNWKKSGHAFICDGYDGEGLYHFNWGWGGYCDGYFKLHATNPTPQDMYTDGSHDSGFIIRCQAILGLQPNNGETMTPPAAVASVFDYGFDGTVLHASFQNTEAETHAFGIGVGEIKNNGTIAVLDDNYSSYGYADLPSGYSWPNMTFDVSTYNLSAGKHKLIFICREGTSGPWLQCNPKDLYFEVNVSGQTISIAQHPITNLQCNSISFPGSLLVNTLQPVVASIKNANPDNEYKQPLYLFASKTSANKGNAIFCSATAIESKATEDVMFYFKPSTSGNYQIWICSDIEGNNIIGMGNVSIVNPPTGTVTLEKTACSIAAGPTTTVSLTVKNTGTVTYYESIWAFLYKKDGNNWVSLGYKESEDLIIKPNKSATVQLVYENVGPGDYRLSPNYSPVYGSNSAKNLGYELFTVASNIATQIDNIGAETQSDAPWYSLDGRKLEGTPTAKGVYIREGKKIVVK